MTRYWDQNKPDAGLEPPKPWSITFSDEDVKIPGDKGETRRKRYLLRLINTSFSATFVFSIDCHFLQVVGADFVPIHDYNTSAVLVGIGQRYNVIVHADPKCPAGQKLPEDGNYWIRTWKANCFGFQQPPAVWTPIINVTKGYEKTGILRYNESSEADPSTQHWPLDEVDLTCSDEPAKKLVPYIPWDVPYPPLKFLERFSIMADSSAQTMYPFAIFSMAGDNTFLPMRVDYSNPTFLNLENKSPWNPAWVVVNEEYNNDTEWVSGPKETEHGGPVANSSSRSIWL